MSRHVCTLMFNDVCSFICAAFGRYLVATMSNLWRSGSCGVKIFVAQMFAQASKEEEGEE